MNTSSLNIKYPKLLKKGSIRLLRAIFECFLFLAFLNKIKILMAKVKSSWKTGQIQNHPEKHPNFKITKQFSSFVFCNRVHFYSFSVFEKKKRLRSFKNPSVHCDFQSEILQKHKTLIILDWGLYLTSKGHFWRLHFFEFFNKNWDFLIIFTRKS